MENMTNYIGSLSKKHEYEFLISADTDDPDMYCPGVSAFLESLSVPAKIFYGPNTNKIQAINADMQHASPFDILFVVSDDMHPVVLGFDDIIARDMVYHFPDIDGALHYNDGLCGKDVTCTLSIMGVNLYNRFGYIYHPSYRSFYCDNEYTDQIRKWKKHVYIPRVIVKHNYTGFAHLADAVYRMNSKKGIPDAATYAARKAQGFPA